MRWVRWLSVPEIVSTNAGLERWVLHFLVQSLQMCPHHRHPHQLRHTRILFWGRRRLRITTRVPVHHSAKPIEVGPLDSPYNQLITPHSRRWCTYEQVRKCDCSLVVGNGHSELYVGYLSCKVLPMVRSQAQWPWWRHHGLPLLHVTGDGRAGALVGRETESGS